MADEVIDCFSDSPDVVLSLYEGTWLGKESTEKKRNDSLEFVPNLFTRRD